jgi:hypothetical protein
MLDLQPNVYIDEMLKSWDKWINNKPIKEKTKRKRKTIE